MKTNVLTPALLLATLWAALTPFVQAFELTFQSTTCTEIKFTMTLEAYEYQHGTSFAIFEGDNQLGIWPISSFFTASSLKNALTLTTTHFTSSGNYDLTYGIYSTGRYPIGYNGNANDPDEATKTVYVTCSGSNSVVTTPSPSPTTTSTPYTPYSTSTSTFTPYTTTFTQAIPCGSPTTITQVITRSGQPINYVATPTGLQKRCTPPPSTPTGDGKKSNIAAIAGGAAGGGVAGIGLVALMMFCVMRRRRRQAHEEEISSAGGAWYDEAAAAAADPEKDYYSGAAQHPQQYYQQHYQPQSPQQAPHGWTSA